MEITLKNIGKLKNATVIIDGITVIAGENNTGKSTVGKALYSFFNAHHSIEDQIRNARISSIRRILNNSFMQYTTRYYIIEPDHLEQVLNDVMATRDDKAIRKCLKSLLEKYELEVSAEEIDSVVKRIIEINLLSDNMILKSVLYRRLDDEFYGQITNLYSTRYGKIALKIKNSEISASISKKNVVKLEGEFNLWAEPIYLDDPFILDELEDGYGYYRWRNYYHQSYNHREQLKRKLKSQTDDSHIIDEIIADQKFSQIYNLISTVCEGDMVIGRNDKAGYRVNGQNRMLDIKNLSTGLKTFVILKKLLMDGTIVENGTIILDEPEIHLHPEWQLILAELTVLIHKLFGVNILLNTHSPYFLNAIEIYSIKHNVNDNCRYYLAKSINDTEAEIQEVTGNLELIYKGLARPLQTLENLRYQDGN